MNKQGNNHSKLLAQLTKAASVEPKKGNSFDKQILDALRQAKQPRLQDILADVAKGKNVHKTAQWDSISPKPMSEPPMDDGLGGIDDGLGGGLQDGEGPHGLGGPEDTLDTAPVEPDGDTESAKQSIAQALVDLCGSPEAACDCVNTLGGAVDDLDNGLGEESPMDGLDEEPLGGDELGTEEMPTPMEAPSPMPMPGPM